MWNKNLNYISSIFNLKTKTSMCRFIFLKCILNCSHCIYIFLFKDCNSLLIKSSKKQSQSSSSIVSIYAELQLSITLDSHRLATNALSQKETPITRQMMEKPLPCNLDQCGGLSYQRCTVASSKLQVASYQLLVASCHSSCNSFTS